MDDDGAPLPPLEQLSPVLAHPKLLVGYMVGSPAPETGTKVGAGLTGPSSGSQHGSSDWMTHLVAMTLQRAGRLADEQRLGRGRARGLCQPYVDRCCP